MSAESAIKGGISFSGFMGSYNDLSALGKMIPLKCVSAVGTRDETHRDVFLHAAIFDLLHSTEHLHFRSVRIV